MSEPRRLVETLNVSNGYNTFSVNVRRNRTAEETNAQLARIARLYPRESTSASRREQAMQAYGRTMIALGAQNRAPGFNPIGYTARRNNRR